MRTSRQIIDIAKKEIGYKEKKSNRYLDSKTANAGKGNYTKYARDLDKIKDFYNGKKNGFPWCDVFVDWCFVQAFGVNGALEMTCQPKKSTGAGTKYSANFYKNKKQFNSTPKIGSQIFFKNSSGTIYHTGIVEKVDSKYVYTIEGNTSGTAGVVADGGCVASKKYAIGDKKIAGYGHPKYDKAPATTTPKVTYFKKYTGSSVSIVTALNSIGVNSSYANRKKIATVNKITPYNGTATQNTKMLKLLKHGKLIKP